MPIYYITFILSFNNYNKLNIDFKDYNSDFKNALNLDKDKKLDLKDNNSLFNFNSKLKEGTSLLILKNILYKCLLLSL
jgi:hypothetical protein